MHLPTNVTKQRPAVYVAVLAVTLVPLYYVSWRYRIAHPFSTGSTRQSRPPSTNFIADWQAVHLIEPFNPSAIAAYCNETVWRPNLVFNLDNANGGVGNVRGNILDFLFFALEAGASIMLPGMASRSQTDISNVWASRAPFGLFFDEDWFLHAMEEACPQMIIYKPSADHKIADPLPGNYLPASRRMDAGKQNTKKAYLQNLDTWLKSKPAYKPDELTLVNLERTLWEIDTRSLPPAFRRSFSQLLRLNSEARRLAAITVQHLALLHPIAIDPRDPVPPQAFYGAHLRTEADAQSAGWLNEPNTNFSAQTDAYIADALKHKLRTVYVASGNSTDLERFKTKAALHRPALNVTSKLDLLPPHELDNLAKLTWDQQALVDYEVLQRCSVFGGFVKSSFSYNIAMARAQWGADMGRVVDPWRVLHSEAGVAFDDGISRILGRFGWHEQRVPRGMWP